MYRVGQSYFYPEVTTMIHGKNTYTTLLYEVIYTTCMWGLRGRYFSTPPSPCPHMQIRDIAIVAILHFRKIGCYPFVAPMVDKSQGKSVRMPKRLKAAPHFCGGRALVNMSAA